jgi:hypothetical protein
MALPDTTRPLGPGTLKIGATGSQIDVSCLVNNAVIAAEKDQGDSTTKLCGDVRPGSVSYTYTMSGNMDTDNVDPAGFFALSQAEAGSVQDYEFTPNTDGGTKAVGQLIVDPLDFGGDETGETMASDFEFALVGAPVYTYGGGVATAAADVGQAGQDDQDRQDVA